MMSVDLNFLESERKNSKEIELADGYCRIDSSVTVTDLLEHQIINDIFPDINRFAELFGSTPIRNSATLEVILTTLHL